MMDVLGEAKKNFDYAVSIRRHMHEYPEVTGCEVETVAMICRELDGMGIEYVVVEDGGVLGFIHGKEDGKTLLLRADMDALPIQESERNLGHDRIVRSKNDGVCHACGHDAHTAMLLSEAKILNEHKDELNGNVVLCFERGEESGGQIRNLLPYLIETLKVKVDGCFGTHVKWDVESGKISAQPGPVMAGGAGFTIKIKGKGGHGSRPDMAKSPIECFVAIYNHMNSIRMDNVSPYDVLSFSVGTLEAGSARNVIPDELTFAGTIRSYNTAEALEPFVDQFVKVLDAECALCGCTYEVISMPKALFECRNNATCCEIAQNAVKKYIGEDALTVSEPWMASESFQAYLKLWPGVFTFTGIQNPEVGSGAPHHTPDFDVDEAAMVNGIAAAVGYTIDFLNYEGDIPFEPYTGDLHELVKRNL